jgi:hypothetical protein
MFLAMATLNSDPGMYLLTSAASSMVELSRALTGLPRDALADIWALVGGRPLGSLKPLRYTKPLRLPWIQGTKSTLKFLLCPLSWLSSSAS